MCTSTPYQAAHAVWGGLASLIPKIRLWGGAEFQKMGHMTKTTPIMYVHLIYSTYIQNLGTLALAVPKIWLQASELRMGHVMLTSPF